MSARIQTEYGSILVDNEVIARVAGLAAIECYGVVGMAALNVKDGIVQLVMGDSLTRGIRVHIQEDGAVSLDFHIIVEYGTNIAAIGENLMSTVRYKVKEMLGVTVSNIDIFVESVRVDRSEK